MQNTHTQLFPQNRPFTAKPSCDLDVLFIRRHVGNIKMAKFEVNCPYIHTLVERPAMLLSV